MTYSIATDYSIDGVTYPRYGSATIVTVEGDKKARYTTTLTDVSGGSMTDSFRVKANSAAPLASSSFKDVTVTIYAVDDPPQITNYNTTGTRVDLAEDGTEDISLDGRASDEEGHGITYSVTSDAGSAGAEIVNIGDVPHLRFSPNTNVTQATNYDIGFYATANGVNSAIGYVYFTVNPSDDKPYFYTTSNASTNLTSFSINEADSDAQANPHKNIYLWANDIDNDNSKITYSVTNTPTYGTATVNTTPAESVLENLSNKYFIHYEMNLISVGVNPNDSSTWPVDANGNTVMTLTDEIKYKATQTENNPDIDSDEKTCTVTINWVNDAIVIHTNATDDSGPYIKYEFDENTDQTFNLNTLVSDEELDSSLTFTIDNGTEASGLINFDNGYIDSTTTIGEYKYVFNASEPFLPTDEAKEDTINFTATASDASSNNGRIKMIVSGIDDPPTWTTAPTTLSVYENASNGSGSDSDKDVILAIDPDRPSAAIMEDLTNVIYYISEDADSNKGTAAIVSETDSNDAENTIYYVKYTINSDYNVGELTETDTFKYAARQVSDENIVSTSTEVQVTLNRYIDLPVGETIGALNGHDDNIDVNEAEDPVSGSTIPTYTLDLSNKIGWDEAGLTDANGTFGQPYTYKEGTSMMSAVLDKDESNNDIPNRWLIQSPYLTGNAVKSFSYRVKGDYIPSDVNSTTVTYTSDSIYHVYFDVTANNDSAYWDTMSITGVGTFTTPYLHVSSMDYVETSDTSWQTIGWADIDDPDDTDPVATITCETSDSNKSIINQRVTSGLQIQIKRKGDSYGTNILRVKGTGVSTKDLTFTVNSPPNQAPTKPTATTTESVEGTENGMKVVWSTTDPEGDTISYQYKEGTNGTWTSGDTWQKDSGVPGTSYTIYGRASDEHGNVSDSGSTTVTVPDRPPTASVSWNNSNAYRSVAVLSATSNLIDLDTGHTAYWKEWKDISGLTNVASATSVLGGTTSADIGDLGEKYKATAVFQSKKNNAWYGPEVDIPISGTVADRGLKLDLTNRNPGTIQQATTSYTMSYTLSDNEGADGITDWSGRSITFSSQQNGTASVSTSHNSSGNNGVITFDCSGSKAIGDQVGFTATISETGRAAGYDNDYSAVEYNTMTITNQPDDETNYYFANDTSNVTIYPGVIATGGEGSTYWYATGDPSGNIYNSSTTTKVFGTETWYASDTASIPRTGTAEGTTTYYVAVKDEVSLQSVISEGATITWDSTPAVDSTFDGTYLANCGDGNTKTNFDYSTKKIAYDQNIVDGFPAEHTITYDHEVNIVDGDNVYNHTVAWEEDGNGDKTGYLVATRPASAPNGWIITKVYISSTQWRRFATLII